MRPESEIVWLDANPTDYWWANEISGIRYQDAETGEYETFSVAPSYAMTDTGASCVYAPTRIFNQMMDQISAAQPVSHYEMYFDSLMMKCD